MSLRNGAKKREDNKAICLISRIRSSEPQIINPNDNVEPQTEFFLEISVNRAQNFEFFELSENVFNNNSF